MSTNIEKTEVKSPYAGAVCQKTLNNPIIALLTGERKPPRERQTEESNRESASSKKS